MERWCLHPSTEVVLRVAMSAALARTINVLDCMRSIWSCVELLCITRICTSNWLQARNSTSRSDPSVSDQTSATRQPLRCIANPQARTSS